MSDPKFGEIIQGDAGRDAVHVAVVPAVAAHILAPGDHVGFADESRETFARVQPRLGIVDPFLTVAVMPGQKFWLFLYPQSISGLRHVWTHHAFDNEAIAPSSTVPSSTSKQRQESENYLASLALECGLRYDQLIDQLAGHVVTGDRICLNTDTPSELYNEDTLELMWMHYNRVTGNPFPLRPRDFIFRCAC